MFIAKANLLLEDRGYKKFYLHLFYKKDNKTKYKEKHVTDFKVIISPIFILYKFIYLFFHTVLYNQVFGYLFY